MAIRRSAPRAARSIPLALACAGVLVAGLAGGCSSGTTSKPKPPGCPDVQAVFVPGTGETRAGADPAVPVGLLKSAAAPIRSSFDPGRAAVYFVPYPATFTDLPNYQASEAAGVKATTDAIAATAGKCPNAHFTLSGYSQGAAVAGDVATQVGQGAGPVSADKVLGVGLVADPNRDPATEKLIGPPVQGAGLAGPRPKNFGNVGDRVVTFSATGDLICATPNVATQLAAALAQLGTYLSSPVHSSYGTYQVDSGDSATVWLANWLTDKIKSAPKG
jgi:hypothetical protein